MQLKQKKRYQTKNEDVNS